MKRFVRKIVIVVERRQVRFQATTSFSLTAPCKIDPFTRCSTISLFVFFSRFLSLFLFSYFSFKNLIAKEDFHIFLEHYPMTFLPRFNIYISSVKSLAPTTLISLDIFFPPRQKILPTVNLPFSKTTFTKKKRIIASSLPLLPDGISLLAFVKVSPGS